ncbi:unnamed protein product [Vitrella brassicaformis CCMP3155]|uniref:Uncharacterized protein n=3 Tax=Vitrella brassicaformis TaxID=1169539 RepID=A0A0G4EXC1_VITBC|nr:unnamed protein product [Vitrella brassicaformis CCMP3155]|eukprot:CEM02740.1 unnamed protein product [Vitrella brassicaformis CCMP3155]
MAEGREVRFPVDDTEFADAIEKFQQITLPWLEYRKFIRRFRGHYRRHSRGRTLLVFALLCILFGIASIEICNKEGRISINFQYGPDIGRNTVFGLGVALLLAVMFWMAWTQVQLNLRWCLYFSYATMIALLIAVIYKGSEQGFSCSSQCDSESAGGCPSNGTAADANQPGVPGDRDMAMLLTSLGQGGDPSSPTGDNMSVLPVLFFVYLIGQVLIFLVSQFCIHVLPLVMLNGWCGVKQCRLRRWEIIHASVLPPRPPPHPPTLGKADLGAAARIYVFQRIPIMRRYCSCLLGAPGRRLSKRGGHRARYVGEVDDAGLPHGFGRWREDEYHGEEIVGYWSHGRPCSPFKAREVGTGSGFICMTLGFAKASLPGTSQSRRRPSPCPGLAPHLGGDSRSPSPPSRYPSIAGWLHDVKGLLWGVAEVECSVSGAFFRDFPRVAITDYPFPPSLPQATPSPSTPGHPPTARTARQTASDVPPALLGEASSVSAPASVPSFTSSIGTSSVVVSVDAERGLFVSGHVYEPSAQASHREHAHAPAHPSEVRIRAAPRHPTREHVSWEWIGQNNGVQPAAARDGGDLEAGIVDGDAGAATTETGTTERSFVGSQGDRDRKQEEARQASSGRRGWTWRWGSREGAKGDKPAGDRDGHTDDGYHYFPRDEADFSFERVELSVDGWQRKWDDRAASEAVIFVPGYNCSLATGLRLFAQLASFCSLPSYMKPFLFHWPGGHTPFAYYSAMENGSSIACGKNFVAFLVALQATGVQQIHLLAHSMGARVALNALRLCAEEGLFRPCDLQPWGLQQQQQQPSGTSPPLLSDDSSAAAQPSMSQPLPPPLELVTATFLNPDYELDDFVSQDHTLLRTFCNMITIYADTRDQALYYAEMFNRKSSLGRRVFSLRRPIVPAEPASPSGSRVAHRGHDDGVMSGRGTKPPSIIKASQVGRSSGTEGWGGRGEVAKREAEWLDVDVIDTTFVEQNVHAIRHVFYTLNREIIDDIREILTTRRRARQRTSRLDRREGNVWVYRVAPSFLVSVTG